MSSYTLLHQDDALLIVVKPAGLLAVPGRGPDKQDCLIARLHADYPDALVVHRLDMATSGLMVFARSPAMQAALSRLFRDRRVHKRYQALIPGRLSPECGEIDLPLIADWPNRPLQKVDFALGKPSLTRYRLLGCEDGIGRVDLEPVTGRSHQLRVHLKERGHPIIGDTLYGGPDAPRLMLHACQLAFSHPLDDAPLSFDSPAPF